MRPIKKQSMIFLSVAIVFSIVLLIFALGIPAGNAVSTVIGPRFWPLSLLVLLLVLSLISMVVTYFEKEKVEVSEEEEILSKLAIEDEGILEVVQQGALQEEKEDANYRHWYLILLIGLYVIMMDFVGFLISTVLFIFVCAMLLGLRNKLHLALTSVIGSAIVFVLFSYLLNIPLP